MDEERRNGERQRQRGPQIYSGEPGRTVRRGRAAEPPSGQRQGEAPETAKAGTEELKNVREQFAGDIQEDRGERAPARNGSRRNAQKDQEAVPVQNGSRRKASDSRPAPGGEEKNTGKAGGRLPRRKSAGQEQTGEPGGRLPRRRREQEEQQRMRVLWGILGVLVVLLIAAVIYEIVLGHGTKKSGAERMAEQSSWQENTVEILEGDGTGGQSSGGEAAADSENGTGAGGQPAGDEAATDGEKGIGAGGNTGDGASTGSGDGTTGDGSTEVVGDTAEGGSTGDGETSGDDSAGVGDGTDGSSTAALQERLGDAVNLTGEERIQAAALLARQYDYDGAVELLKSSEDYASSEAYQTAAAEYEAEKAACVEYPAEEVTHVFFHTLIHDPALAFDGDEYQEGYNQFMVTEYEFNSIMEQMYERGYVMVHLTDIISETKDEQGRKKFAPGKVHLPQGKIPFVLSQDDVSYYHYMDGDGFARRLIVDDNGDVRNEYIEADGSISVGDYDMVPLVDRFVEKHPDFAYHGHKGYIALTGYEGILGYRTDEVYKTKEPGRVTVQQQMFLDSCPDGFTEADFEQECEGAKKVAEAMKGNGWKFASHTWGHQNMSEKNGVSWDTFVRDTDRWETWVEPLIGETDTLIYAFGGDIMGWEPYTGDRFHYLKEKGFDYYCGVDSAKYWLQVGEDYVRQSRRNIDGYRMYYNPDMLSDLFDVSEAWDPLRPATVAQI